MAAYTCPKPDCNGSMEQTMDDAEIVDGVMYCAICNLVIYEDDLLTGEALRFFGAE